MGANGEKPESEMLPRGGLELEHEKEKFSSTTLDLLLLPTKH